MKRLRDRAVVISMLACMAGVSGCAQPGKPSPIWQRQTTIGTLKTSVSELEYEKEQLKKELAELKADNSKLADELTQEEESNGEISARLDDARVLLRSRGFDTESLASPSRRGSDSDEGATTKPAGQSSKRRRPPFARIPGRIDTAPEADDSDAQEDVLGAPASTRSSRDDLGPQSRRDREGRGWRKVAAKDGILGATSR